MTRTEASQAFSAADAEWLRELESQFGREAGRAAYDQRRLGVAGDKINTLWRAREKAQAELFRSLMASAFDGAA